MIRAKILDSSVELTPRKLVTPFQLSKGLITTATEASARVRVSVDGREAEGRGSIYLSVFWSWQGDAPSYDEKEKQLCDLATSYSKNLSALCGDAAAHPLLLGLRLHENISHNDGPPVLARAMCASPFDAAIHDAVGQVLGRSAFSFYDEDFSVQEADHLFSGKSASSAIRSVLQKPREALESWWLISAKDDLNTVVRPHAESGAYHCFKIKLLAKDNAEDVARTVEVYKALKQFCTQTPRISLDSNEANPTSESVLDYLEQLKKADAETYAAVEYLEQPTSRDLQKFPNDWRAVTKHKPVMLDEGLTGIDSFALSKEQGWSGFALKTCKGHSFALLSAAWAAENGLQLAMQDLTNPGYSAIHSFAFSAHLPTVNGVELNSPQFTPAANEPWLPRLAPLFQPRNGFHRLPMKDFIGLGSQL